MFRRCLASAAIAFLLSSAPMIARADVPAVELVDGAQIAGKVVDEEPGRFVIVERPSGAREAYEWSHVKKVEGRDPKPIPPPPAGIIPRDFKPADIPKLADQAKQTGAILEGLAAAKNGTQLVGSIQNAQDALEKLGLRRGPPDPAFAGGSASLLAFCFFSNYGNLAGPQALYFGPFCKVGVFAAAAGLAAAPFLGGKTPELDGPSVHHVDLTVYALDYSKKSALTGSLKREPQGGIAGNNLGYDLGYTYIHPKIGLIGYGHLTLQQTTISESDFFSVSNNFFKLDAQVGMDFIRLLSGGKKDSYWTQHAAFVRGGPTFFHDWIVGRDQGSGLNERYTLANPLNQSIGLVTGGGFEIAAEVDFHFPFGLGGFHFAFERGYYPSIAFPSLNPRDAAFVALVGFDDLRTGDSYSWQRLRADLELPINFSRKGAVSLGGQLIKYENNFGSGVDNRGLSLDYKFRWQ